MPRSARLTSSVAGDRVVQVGGRHLERAPQERGVAHEQAAALVRLVQPLVRVERDRVRAVDPVERAPAALGQHREPAVGARPRGTRARARGRPRRARASGSTAPVFVAPRVRREEERHAAGAPVGLDGAPERLGAEAQVGADGEDADLVGPEPEDAAAARERRVRLVGDVRDEAVVHRADDATRARRRARSCSPPSRRSASVPPAVSGRPIQPRNHSSTSSSSCVGPAASIHEPA